MIVNRSFFIDLPPNPIPLSKNLLPIRVSDPIQVLTSLTSASYYSQNMAMLLIEDRRWAKKQVATNRESSDEALLVYKRLF